MLHRFRRGAHPYKGLPLFRSAALLLLAAASAAAPSFDHSPLDRVLKAHVNAIGEVDYAGLKKNPAELDRYLQALGQASPDSKPELFPARNDKLAYWLNAYNAFVLKGVSAEYPVKSVKDLGALYSFFWRRKFIAGGRELTLNHIEDEIIRKGFRDPRIHFVLACGAVSCPFLGRDALTGAALDGQLEEAARRFVNQRRNFTPDAARNEVALAGLYNLRNYDETDFLPEIRKQNPGRKVTILDYLRRYLSAENRKALEALKDPKIRFYEYDWPLNDRGSRARARLPQERELARQ